MQPEIADSHERQEALDTRRSFIVQAPAGSGKTSLLTPRFLALLACVASPEEILAITFTRKAAGEMRNRIVEALESATRDEPGDAYQQTIRKLATRALEQDRKRGWSLLENPHRLRVQTIDSFCAGISHFQ